MKVDGRVVAKNLDFIEIDQFSDKDNLPTCISDFALRITDEKIRFPNDVLACSNDTTDTPSDVIIDGDIFIDDSEKLNITVRSDDFNTELLEHITYTLNTGSLSFNTSITNTTEDPQIRTSVNSNQMSFDKKSGDSLDLDLSYDINNEFDLSNL